MKLFKYEGYNITISEEALALKPFRDIWRRDKSAKKDNAIQELAYIYFMADPRSDYQYMVDPEERSAAVIEGEGMRKGWKPDKMVQDALTFYSSFKPLSSLLLEDTRVAVDKLRKLLKEIDLNQVDDRGKPVYTLNTITATIKQIPTLVKELEEAERAIAREIIQNDKVRGSNEKNMMEDL